MFARKYEIVVIVHPDAGEDGVDKTLGRMREEAENAITPDPD